MVLLFQFRLQGYENIFVLANILTIYCNFANASFMRRIASMISSSLVA